MARALRTSTFVLLGLVVDRVDQTGEAVLVIVRSSTPTSLCPGCLAPSKRIHSRYRRRLSDLPWPGRSVQLVLLARRFYCDAVLCGRVAALVMHDDRWGAGEAMMQAQDPTGWRELSAGGDLVQANRDAIASC